MSIYQIKILLLNRYSCEIFYEICFLNNILAICNLTVVVSHSLGHGMCYTRVTFFFRVYTVHTVAPFLFFYILI
jgi:hypothetical protein